MIEEGDKIAVCISGGKDSMLLAKCMQEIQRHGKQKFELVFLVMNPGYNKANQDLIDYNSKLMSIPVEIFESDIFESVVNIEKSPCYQDCDRYFITKALLCQELSQISAITSTSTSTPLGSALAATQERAGFEVKYLP